MFIMAQRVVQRTFTRFFLASRFLAHLKERNASSFVVEFAP